MSFEEEFPSLQHTNWFEMVDNGELDNVIHSIQDHCLDKQSVKEAIQKVYDELSNEEVSNEAYVICCEFAVELSKELGLEEEK